MEGGGVEMEKLCLIEAPWGRSPPPPLFHLQGAGKGEAAKGRYGDGGKGEREREKGFENISKHRESQ